MALSPFASYLQKPLTSLPQTTAPKTTAPLSFSSTGQVLTPTTNTPQPVAAPRSPFLSYTGNAVSQPRVAGMGTLNAGGSYLSNFQGLNPAIGQMSTSLNVGGRQLPSNLSNLNKAQVQAATNTKNLSQPTQKTPITVQKPTTPTIQQPVIQQPQQPEQNQFQIAGQQNQLISPQTTDQTSQLSALRQQYLSSLAPSQEELNTQQQLNNIINSANLGMQKVGEQVIPMEFITGEQQQIEQRGNLQAQTLQTKLAALQAQRQAQAQRAEAELGFVTPKTQELTAGSSLIRYNPTTGQTETVAQAAPKPNYRMTASGVMYDTATGQIVNTGSTGAGGTSDVDAQAQAVLRGEAAISQFPGFGANSLKSKVMSRVYELDPTFDLEQSENSYKQKQTAMKSFAPGGKDYLNVKSLNTAVNHLDELKQAADKLNNSSLPIWNQIRNVGLEAVGSPVVNNFKTAANAVVNEMASVFKNTSGTDQEIQAWRGSINSAQSPQQIQGAINTLVNLMSGRLNAIKEGYTSVMGQEPNFNILTPSSSAIIQRLTGQQLENPTGQTIDTLSQPQTGTETNSQWSW